MGVRAAREEEDEAPAVYAPARPSPLAAVLLAVVLFAALLANGRPIGAGDTRATEHVAASLVQEGDFDLDEYPEVEPPFARTVRDASGGERRVSIYPVLSAVVAAPVFAVCRFLFALDETGSALAGKIAAAGLSAAAAAVLFLALTRRRLESDAAWTAALFALGTSVWSTSQALWQHPLAVLALALAVLCILDAHFDPVWAGRAGLPLGLAVAARHADVALVAVLAIGVIARWPRRAAHLLLWALPPALFVLLYDWRTFGSPWQQGFSGAVGRFSAPWGEGHLGLLVSPAKGLLVFTPVVVVAAAGLLRAFRAGERWLATTLGTAVVAHWLLTGRWSEWHGGASWGPRLMTDVLPLLFVFVPDGFDLLRPLGLALAAVSVSVQALGAFAYDYRWERLHQTAGVLAPASLWDWADSPIPFYVRRRVVVVAAPALLEGRVFIREHPLVLFAPRGSRVEFAGQDPLVTGVEATVEDVHLQRGARVENGRLHLRGRWDALFLRVTPEARLRRLELRLAGTGRGVLYVGERSFWSESPRWTTYPVSGSFLLRHPYYFPESMGPDLVVTVGLGGGESDLVWAGLVPPGEPLHVLRVPASSAR